MTDIRGRTAFEKFLLFYIAYIVNKTLKMRRFTSLLSARFAKWQSTVLII